MFAQEGRTATPCPPSPHSGDDVAVVPLSSILAVMLTASKSTWEDLVNLALRFNDLETESTPVDKKGQADASVLFLLARDHFWWRGTASSR